MIGVPLTRLEHHRVTRLAWGMYPLLVTFVIVATANHFVIPVLGGLASALGAWVVAWMARARSAARAFAPAEATA
jgi:hypothetical protein